MLQKTILIVLDGVGEYENYHGNAVTQARMPFFEHLYQTYPWALVDASGNAVGVPEGVQGASEPGHLIMGAGRVVFQPMEEINQAIKHGTFFTNEYYLECCNFVKKNNGTLHLIGMISDGGVHSHLNHLYALLELAKAQGIARVYIHGITDGRDVPERSGSTYVQEIQKQIEETGIGTIATLIGRYYAMDRDNNFDRTMVAYDLITKDTGTFFEAHQDAFNNFYSNAPKELSTDYYLTPVKLLRENTAIQTGDGVIFFNFRSDRARQLSACFAPGTFTHFERKPELVPHNISFICTGPYSDNLPVAFPPRVVKNNLGSWISHKGLHQLRIAETEKYAHVTYFFNSQVEAAFEGEDRVMVPSPKVPSYAQQPEMNAGGVAEKTVEAIVEDRHDFIAVNFANGDLVGHSGVFEPTKSAMETLDRCVETIVEKALEKKYDVLITADHGNAEYMINPDGSQNPSHTLNPVRAVVISHDQKYPSLKKGLGLASVGPTVLKMMGLDVPPEMDVESLV